MKPLITVSRIIVGSVFIFSGFVKAIDPLGSAFKFTDYFMAFNLGFLKFSALPLAILLCTFEFLAGFSVLTGLRHKSGAWASLILIVFFTPLTFILALTNPVSDCGCFGDAIHLTNWQTFAKNIILLLFILVVFSGRKKARPVFKTTTEWLIISGIACLFTGFSFFNLRYLPIIDFLPYKTGVNITEAMKIPVDAVPDVYETFFVYEKDGVIKEFTIKDYPANDSTWKYVSRKSVLIKRGYEPPIHGFSISTIDNLDITEKILKDPNYSILMISRNLDQAETTQLKNGFEFGFYCMRNNINFYILTASESNTITKFENGLTFCLSDETALKTFVRSNPGYVLLKGGTIIGKWSSNNLPDTGWFNDKINNK